MLLDLLAVLPGRQMATALVGNVLSLMVHISRGPIVPILSCRVTGKHGIAKRQIQLERDKYAVYLFTPSDKAYVIQSNCHYHQHHHHNHSRRHSCHYTCNQKSCFCSTLGADRSAVVSRMLVTQSKAIIINGFVTKIRNALLQTITSDCADRSSSSRKHTHALTAHDTNLAQQSQS